MNTRDNNPEGPGVPRTRKGLSSGCGIENARQEARGEALHDGAV